MKALELRDIRGHVFLTLDEVFSNLPARAKSSQWQVSDYVDPDGGEYFELGGNGVDTLSEIANSGRAIPGQTLALLARTSSQVIWGTFDGYDPGADKPWVRLHAIDSTFWRCETADIATRQSLLKTFNDVRLVEQ